MKRGSASGHSVLSSFNPFPIREEDETPPVKNLRGNMPQGQFWQTSNKVGTKSGGSMVLKDGCKAKSSALQTFQ